MQSIRSAFRLADGLLLILAVLWVLLYVLAAGGADGGFPLDDSWIHQVYGRNLAQSGEWAFVPGQPSAASTSPLYTVLLAAGYALGVPYVVWTHVLGVLALFAAGCIGARMADMLLPKQRWLAMLSGAAVVSAWHLIWAAASGMETMLFSLLTLALMALAWREDAKGADSVGGLAVRGAQFGVLGALATLARPEGLVLMGVVGLLMVLLRPMGSFRRALLWGAAAGFSFFIVIGPYLLLNLHLTGGLLPDTAAAKQAQAASILASTSFPQRVLNMLQPLVAGGQVLLLPGVVFFAVAEVAALRREPRRLWRLLPLIWAAALIGLYAARLPAPYQHGRYVIPALPGIMVVGVVGTAELMRLGRHMLVGRVLTRGLAVSVVLISVYFAAVIGPETYARDVRIIDEEMVTAALWIKEHIPTDELLAIHDIGAVGFFAPRPLVDIAGLVTPEMIPLIGDEAATWAFLRERDARFLMAFPNQIPGGDVNDEHLCPVFSTNNPTALAAGGQNMAVYALTWDGSCPDN